MRAMGWLSVLRHLLVNTDLIGQVLDGEVLAGPVGRGASVPVGLLVGGHQPRPASWAAALYGPPGGAPRDDSAPATRVVRARSYAGQRARCGPAHHSSRGRRLLLPRGSPQQPRAGGQSQDHAAAWRLWRSTAPYPARGRKRPATLVLVLPPLWP